MPSRRVVFGTIVGAMFALVGARRGMAASIGPITEKAQRLLRFYDGLGVETRWLAGAHVNWETGVSDGGPVPAAGKHTHCSAFVGSVAKQLGIYILRPPDHGQTLLANAQLAWLEAAGAEGWQSLADAAAAVAAANAGRFVVASYRNHNDAKPGHIAIVRPSRKSAVEIETDGPDIMQAGGHNFTRTTLAQGFADHPLAWARGKEVRFFAHDWAGTISPIG